MTIFSLLLATVCSLGELDEQRHDMLDVTTEGIVVDVIPDEVDVRYTILLLKDGATTLPVFCKGQLKSENLRDARVRISGTYQRLMGGFRRFFGPFIHSEANQIDIIKSPPADRLQAPIIDPANYVTPRTLAKMDKRAVVGRVLAVWDSNRVMLKVSGHIVHATLASDVRPPRLGSTIKLAGYPETNLYFLNFIQANWREVAPSTPDHDTAQAMSADQIMTAKKINPRIESNFNGMLIKLSGVISSLPDKGSAQHRLYINSGNYRVPIDLSACPSVAEDLSLGCTIEVVGRCVMETKSRRAFDVFPQIRGFAVILRSEDDLKITSYPSWWYDKRILWIISPLIALIAILFIKGRIERAMAQLRLSERTRLAVEIHDTISQTLTGVACQIAAVRSSVECDPAAAKTRLETAERMLGTCRRELKNCLFDLRNDTLAENDFSLAVSRTLEPFLGETEITVRITVERSQLSETTAHAILAILRELTANAVRHGAAASVKIAGCTTSEAFIFSVRDDGRGFCPDEAAGPIMGHFGLSGIKDRLNRIGGEFTVKSAPGRGTKARFSIPRAPMKDNA
jgi:signal transduction histidine kinase